MLVAHFEYTLCSYRYNISIEALCRYHGILNNLRIRSDFQDDEVYFNGCVDSLFRDYEEAMR